ncbi:MAG: molybdenum cofactor guanylyltransferase [Dehalococcoidia bacterium]
MNAREAVTAVVVAGGKSTRFGSDKASAIVAGRPLLGWVVRGVSPACEALVVVRAEGQALPEAATDRPVKVVDDLYEGKGPLAGLVAGLAACETPLAFAVSCDVPLVRSDLVTGLAGLAAENDIVIPHVDGFPQPLLAIYRVESCLPVFRRAVEEERLKITHAFLGLRVRAAREPEVRAFDPDLESFTNLNRADDLSEIEALLLKRGGHR